MLGMGNLHLSELRSEITALHGMLIHSIFNISAHLRGHLMTGAMNSDHLRSKMAVEIKRCRGDSLSSSLLSLSGPEGERLSKILCTSSFARLARFSYSKCGLRSLRLLTHMRVMSSLISATRSVAYARFARSLTWA